jgi:hypothetical protein
LLNSASQVVGYRLEFGAQGLVMATSLECGAVSDLFLRGLEQAVNAFYSLVQMLAERLSFSKL